MKKLATVFILALSGFIYGCGQTGPLYVPASQPLPTNSVSPTVVPGAPSTQPLNPQTQQSGSN